MLLPVTSHFCLAPQRLIKVPEVNTEIFYFLRQRYYITDYIGLVIISLGQHVDTWTGESEKEKKVKSNLMHESEKKVRKIWKKKTWMIEFNLTSISLLKWTQGLLSSFVILTVFLHFRPVANSK